MSKLRKVRVATNVTMRTLLKASVAVGFAGVVVVAPNSLQAIEFFVDQYDKKKKRGKRFNEQFVRSNYFEVNEIGKEKYVISLSKKGRLVAHSILFDEYEIPKSVNWDKKWHLLIFDIREEDRSFRDAMRRKISDLGLVLLQNSVYVYPYSLDEFVSQLKQAYPEEAENIITIEATRVSSNQPFDIFKTRNLI